VFWFLTVTAHRGLERAVNEERMVAKGRGETARCRTSSFIEPGRLEEGTK